MFIYQKKLQYPVRIAKANPALAKIIITQYGGPNGELGASMRYLSQRYSMPYPQVQALLTDIGTEGAFLHTHPQRLSHAFPALSPPCTLPSARSRTKTHFMGS